MVMSDIKPRCVANLHQFITMVTTYVSALLLATACSCYQLPTPVHPENTFRSSRIVSGSDASISQAPWQLSLQTQSGSHICGAIMIKEGWALTAAHCVSTTGSYQVYGGSALRSGNGETSQVSSVIIHPNYNKGAGAYPNDVAVLRLQRTDLTSNANIQIAKWNTSYSVNANAGKRCRITGWGRLSGGGSVPNQLQIAEMTLISDSECTTRWGNNFQSSAHVCVFDNVYGTSSACNGDSGGPLECDGQVIGVTSWVASGCLSTYPSVYARLPNYISWVESQIGGSLI